MTAAKGYATLIRFGRALTIRPQLAETHPELIIAAAQSAERDLFFSPIENFFSLFPPIKRYADDGTWDYHSTLEMRRETLGTNFGKGDLLELLMTRCYESRAIRAFGIGLMIAINRMSIRKKGIDIAQKALEMIGEGGRVEH